MRGFKTFLADLACMMALLALAAMGILLAPSCASAQVPPDAARHRAELVRSARAVWGLAAPVATFAAQVHQESGWRPGATSRVGAAGLAQFMPGTAAWIAGQDAALAANQPFNPGWALRAMVTYDAWLGERLRIAQPTPANPPTSTCEHWAAILSAYNGGLGWVQRDRRLAATQGLDPAVWFGAVERVNAGRSPANWQENRDYPRRILWRHEALYVAAGWGPGVCT